MINISVSMRLPSTTCTMENGSESTRAQSARRKSSTKYAWGPSAGEKDADRRVKDEKTEKLPRLLRKKEGLITAVRRSQSSSAREQEDEIERIKRANRRESLAFGNATADESRPNSARSISPDSSAVTGGEGGGNSSQNIWIEFENHIKSIDDDSSKIRTFQQNKVNFRSSETFQKVAGEFRSEKSRQNIGFGTNLRIKKFTANRSNKHQETEPQHGENETETENQINPEKETKQGKPMRWSVIKQGVKEVQEEKKGKDAGNLTSSITIK
ncbi:uncharacterized protein LOC106165605 [Lingula anatina]|uniref:Uncharacterized protein LOC106165605 n=1 Tax=Lingula anatina TaxID=7574 RepID=A0A1S3IN34_LINAN|nr:uncharacterized protein LOC106165605 [Lingula anatina]XP_013399312.1 uncharacterized protein LOC106165605 [Lingula anatina]XP_013399313.1 uncharacterized protein LOC106165605 [Lingula anatina]|eukprot:XP_013399311.1 uncharacterized protein LOC106165605 [Lingula anatina]